MKSSDYESSEEREEPREEERGAKEKKTKKHFRRRDEVESGGELLEGTFKDMTIKDDFKARLKDDKKQLDKEKDRLSKERKELKDDKKRLGKEKDRLSKERKELKDDKKRLDEERKELKEIERSLERSPSDALLQEKFSQKKSEVDRIQERIDSHEKEIIAASGDIRAREADFIRRQQILDERQRTIDDREARLFSLLASSPDDIFHRSFGNVPARMDVIGLRPESTAPSKMKPENALGRSKTTNYSVVSASHHFLFLEFLKDVHDMDVEKIKKPYKIFAENLYKVVHDESCIEEVSWTKEPELLQKELSLSLLISRMLNSLLWEETHGILRADHQVAVGWNDKGQVFTADVGITLESVNADGDFENLVPGVSVCEEGKQVKENSCGAHPSLVSVIEVKETDAIENASWQLNRYLKEIASNSHDNEKYHVYFGMVIGPHGVRVQGALLIIETVDGVPYIKLGCCNLMMIDLWDTVKMSKMMQCFVNSLLRIKDGNSDEGRLFPCPMRGFRVTNNLGSHSYQGYLEEEEKEEEREREREGAGAGAGAGRRRRKGKMVVWKTFDYGSFERSRIRDVDRRRPNLDIMKTIHPGYLHGMRMVNIDQNIQYLVYDHIKGSHKPKNVKQFAKICRDLGRLHCEKFVHGDVRVHNMLFGDRDRGEGHNTGDDDDAWLIDFDFAGKEDEDKYPYGLLPIDERDPRACILPRQCLRIHHDRYSLRKCFEILFEFDKQKSDASPPDLNIENMIFADEEWNEIGGICDPNWANRVTPLRNVKEKELDSLEEVSKVMIKYSEMYVVKSPD